MMKLYIALPDYRLVGSIYAKGAVQTPEISLYGTSEICLYFIDLETCKPVALEGGALIEFGAKESGRFDSSYMLKETGFVQGVDSANRICYRATLTVDTKQLRAVLGASCPGVSQDDREFATLQGGIRITVGENKNIPCTFDLRVKNSIFSDGAAGPDPAVDLAEYPEAGDLDGCQGFAVGSVSGNSQIVKPHRYTVNHTVAIAFGDEVAVYRHVAELPTNPVGLSDGNTIKLVAKWPDPQKAGYELEVLNGAGGASLAIAASNGVEKASSLEFTWCNGEWSFNGPFPARDPNALTSLIDTFDLLGDGVVPKNQALIDFMAQNLYSPVELPLPTNVSAANEVVFPRGNGVGEIPANAKHVRFELVKINANSPNGFLKAPVVTAGEYTLGHSFQETNNGGHNVVAYFWVPLA